MRESREVQDIEEEIYYEIRYQSREKAHQIGASLESRKILTYYTLDGVIRDFN